MADAPAFGRWLKQRRHALDLTQDALAEQVGCSTDTIRKLEAERARASRQLAQRLAEQLALAPEEQADFVHLARSVRTADGGAADGVAPRMGSPSHRVRLPTPLTPLIGRTVEVAAVTSALARPAVRLVTLVGPPGIGKTRLSLQVAANLRDAFADGTCFVDLAPISDPDLVVSAIAHALGVKEAGRQALPASLRHYLQDRRMLVVLDNFEQVLDAVPLVVDLLAASHELKLLVTSREALRIQGEHQLPVPPLALPDLTGPLAVAQVVHSPAVALFVAGAQAVTPDFRLTDANAATVAAICAALDGLPLAIELVAARSTLFSPPALLARLQHRDDFLDTGRLALLTRGRRDLPARQQTLRRAISWSYDLLTSELQALFAQLGVFVGGCTLAAVETVCTPPADARDVVLAESPGAGSWDPLDGVAALLEKSLLRREPAGSEEREPRVVMLETLRAYALERLLELQDVERTRRQHAMFYLTLVEAAEPELMGEDQGRYLQRLEVEYENLRAAIRWLLTADPALALRLTGALWRFWLLQSQLSDGRRWLEAALAATPPTPQSSAARATALNGAGVLAHYQGDYSRAAVLCGESLTLSRHAADPRGIAAALRGLALVARSAHNYGAARAMYQESLALSRELGDRWSTAASLCHLGVVELYDADYAAARPVLEESLALFSAVGDRAGLTLACHCLGIVSWGEGDHQTAWSQLAEALAYWQMSGDRRYVALSLQIQGRVASATSDFAEARALFESSVAILTEVGDTYEAASTLEGLAEVAVQLGQAAWAARLLGAAAALRAALGVPRAKIDGPCYTRTAGAACRALGEEAFACAWAEGQALSPAQALAAQDGTPPSQPNRGTRQPATTALPAAAAAAGLTMREVEVLRLVATGLTDAQVAEQLVVSLRTIHAHLRSIYSKLQVTSRSAATRYAIEHHLL